jgi:alpha-maltose-1-phosphate synthase
MKVLLLYPYPLENDGLSLQGYYLAKGLEELNVEVISCDREDNKRKHKLYKEFNPDFVISIGFWGNTPSIVQDPLDHGMKVIPWFNANGWIANYHETLNELPLILATSNWVKSTYNRDGVLGNIQVASIGFNQNIFYPKDKNDPEVIKMRKELGIKGDEVFLFTAGGDVTSKGAQEMFKALAKIDKQFPNWKYVLKTYPSFSADNHGKEERALIRELNLDEKKFIYLSDEYTPEFMAKLLQSCDVYAAPSRLEGFGMIQLEAQACGKPVISINVGGPKDVVVNNKTGFLVDVEHEIKLESEWVYKHMGFDKKKRIEFPIPKTFAYRANTIQLADCTLKLFKDKTLREKMGKQAAEHAFKNFNYKFIAQKIVKLVNKHVSK